MNKIYSTENVEWSAFAAMFAEVGWGQRDPAQVRSPFEKGSHVTLGFAKLIDRMESCDILLVTKLDRLGRNAMDVRASVLKALGCACIAWRWVVWISRAQPAR